MAVVRNSYIALFLKFLVFRGTSANFRLLPPPTVFSQCLKIESTCGPQLMQICTTTAYTCTQMQISIVNFHRFGIGFPELCDRFSIDLKQVFRNIVLGFP